VLEDAGAVAAQAYDRGEMLTAWHAYRRACEVLDRRQARLNAATDPRTRARALRAYEQALAAMEQAQPGYEDAQAHWVRHRQRETPA
jgi:hypothetical protein